MDAWWAECEAKHGPQPHTDPNPKNPISRLLGPLRRLGQFGRKQQPGSDADDSNDNPMRMQFDVGPTLNRFSQDIKDAVQQGFQGRFPGAPAAPLRIPMRGFRPY